jgi:hypothetical protein
MFFDAFDARDKALRRFAEKRNGARVQRGLQIDIEFSRQGQSGENGLSPEIGIPECACCRHRHCPVCEECSASKQYSDYWICHRCGELNLRVSKLDLREVPHGLGKD